MRNTIFSTIFCMAAGYLIGTFNPAFLIAKWQGFDIRERGSGNAGASNAIITMGKGVGIFSALFDIAKAVFAVWLARRFFPELTYAAEIAGICTILGHIFPFAMHFRGGKGLACLGGVILAFSAKVFWIMLAIELVITLIVDFIVVVPLTASVAFPIVYYFVTGKVIGAVLYALMVPVFFYKHVENLKRIRNGTEAHFSFLWRRDAEIERIKKQVNELGISTDADPTVPTGKQTVKKM